MSSPKHIKYRGKVYVKAAAPKGAFSMHMQRLFKYQGQMMETLQEMRG